jgi:hypothetical protein
VRTWDDDDDDDDDCFALHAFTLLFLLVSSCC